MKISVLAAALALGLFVAGPVLADDATAPKPLPRPRRPSPTPPPRPPRPQECSKQADAKDLHGKERKKFREECKKGEM